MNRQGGGRSSSKAGSGFRWQSVNTGGSAMRDRGGDTQPYQQLSFDFSQPQTENDSPFQVADRSGHYTITRAVTVEEIFSFCRAFLLERCKREGECTTAQQAQDLCLFYLDNHHSEVFASLFLDNRHRVIAFEKIFFGTIDGCSVHPREVVRRALYHNAAALILAHNHPSGVLEPSNADRTITHRLKDALALVDVRVVDHILVGGGEAYSFAQHGLI
jgi:DNA repair protein RadC